jgi:hypothetical protein
MIFILLSRIIFILFIIINPISNLYNITSSNSFYYEEKYFRILSNNYDSIDPGNFWDIIKAQDENRYLGIGFNAKKDFGSLILLKDWSMYNFKLTKIIFRNGCSFKIEDKECDAEMLLYHTKDNGYYPPGRRIFMKENFFIIAIPFFKADENNPSNDLLFQFLNLGKFSQNGINITPLKPVKLYQIIQNQPSYLFEGKFDGKDTLFMVFTQYHFISNTDLINLKNALTKNNINSTNIISFDSDNGKIDKIYRNMKNSEKLNPKVSLMIYSIANYLNNTLLFLIIFLILI